MDDFGQGLIYHSVTCLPDSKGKIRVLTVCRGKPGVKPSYLLPQISGKKDCRTGNVIHILNIIVFWLVRIIQSAIIPSRTIAPDDSSGLLKPSVGIHQLGAYHTDGLIRLNQVHKGGQPSSCHLGIIVQKHEVMPAGRLRPMVAIP